MASLGLEYTSQGLYPAEPTGWAELELRDSAKYLVLRLERRPSDDEVVFRQSFASGVKKNTIERDTGLLTRQENKENAGLVASAMLSELRRWHSFKCCSLHGRREARNFVDCRWVLKWKIADGRRIIRLGLTLRGFKVAQAGEVARFASTASWWGQRLVNSSGPKEADLLS